MRHGQWFRAAVMGAAILPLGTLAMAQAPASAAAPRSSGTVKAISSSGFTVTNAAGQDATVVVGATSKVLLVDPTTKDVKAATVGTLADVAVGDKAIVSGTPGDAPTALTATRVYLLKAAAIAQSHAAADAAWAQGLGGIVKSVDPAGNKIVLASGLKTITVTTTPRTIVRRYAGTSVKFADATMSRLDSIQPGDQLRVRGVKSADGLAIVADEMVAGTFRNYSGLLISVDATAGTVTLKDLATKKTVTVALTASSDVRRLPPMLAQRIALQMKGGAAAGTAAGTAAGGTETAPGAGRPAGYGAPGAGPGASPAGGARRAGGDLSSMLSRLPTQTAAELKPGDAVMIVATTGDGSQPTAVTLLAGVDAILTASPTGEMTLSPWSMGGSEGEGSVGGAQ